MLLRRNNWHIHLTHPHHQRICDLYVTDFVESKKIDPLNIQDCHAAYLGLFKHQSHTILNQSSVCRIPQMEISKCTFSYLFHKITLFKCVLHITFCMDSTSLKLSAKVLEQLIDHEKCAPDDIKKTFRRPHLKNSSSVSLLTLVVMLKPG